MLYEVITDAKNQVITHEYDDLGRETLTTYTAAQASPYMTLSTVKTDYDFSGNVAKVTETKTDNTDSGNDFTDVTVITSYSIHYTKLYEEC